mmetsp:Transcript_72629/g.115931  ORF Transcript_72629/g.115931 Transcript_72629/m.115931 type:complete len:310 (-) Transcript_72629:652-1581(-)
MRTNTRDRDKCYFIYHSSLDKQTKKKRKNYHIVQLHIHNLGMYIHSIFFFLLICFISSSRWLLLIILDMLLLLWRHLVDHRVFLLFIVGDRIEIAVLDQIDLLHRSRLQSFILLQLCDFALSHLAQSLDINAIHLLQVVLVQIIDRLLNMSRSILLHKRFQQSVINTGFLHQLVQQILDISSIHTNMHRIRQSIVLRHISHHMIGYLLDNLANHRLFQYRPEDERVSLDRINVVDGGIQCHLWRYLLYVHRRVKVAIKSVFVGVAHQRSTVAVFVKCFLVFVFNVIAIALVQTISDQHFRFFAVGDFRI